MKSRVKQTKMYESCNAVVTQQHNVLGGILILLPGAFLAMLNKIFTGAFAPLTLPENK